MIQFNLLPDVKLDYIKAERTKRTVITVASLATLVVVVIFLLLVVTVDGLQKKNMRDLNRDIAANSSQLEKTPNLNKILTIQNQLSTLTTLHNQKPVASRLFTDLANVTPATVTISSLSADFTQDTLSISGNAATLDQVNTYVDTLKYATYKAANGQSATPFSAVVLSAFSRNSSGASYTITLKFDPIIFSETNNIRLDVAPQVTTRSVLEQPQALFQSRGRTK